MQKMNIAALGYPGFRLYLIGNISGLNGNWMTRLLIGWLAWDLTQSSSFVGLVSFLNFAPVLLGGPVFGVIVDRVDVKRAALIVQSAILGLSLMFVVIMATDALTPTLLSVFAVLIGTAYAAYQPVRLSLGPRLVEHEHVSSVITLGAINFNISRLTGPALGGFLIASLGETPTLLIASALHMPFLASLSFLTPRTETAASTTESYRDAFLAGLHFIRNTRSVWVSFIAIGIFSMVVRGVLEILPILADGEFHKGAEGLGLMTASVGIGAIIASILQISLPADTNPSRPNRGVIAVICGGVFMVLLGLTNSWMFSLFLVAGLGFCSAMAGISFQTSVQTQLEDKMRGRVMSLWMTLAVGGTAIGALVIGNLSDLLGLSTTFIGLGGLATFLLLACVPLLKG